MSAVPTASLLRLRSPRVLRSRAARGDAAAFAVVYERHHQALYRYCRSILRHEQDAQDALQSTMARAFAALQNEQRDFELRPWLFRIAHNEAISILRRRRDTAELDESPGPDDVADRVQERADVRTLRADLADLPERQRAALVLRELNGLSHEEIAAVLDSTPNAVKQSIFQARSAMLKFRDGREMDCEPVQHLLSDGDGRVLRGGAVRAHLRSCTACRRFQDDLSERRRTLALLAPPLPAGPAVALLQQLLAGAGTSAPSALATKAAVMVAVVATAAGGGTALERFERPAPRPAAPGRAATHTASRPVATAVPAGDAAATGTRGAARESARAEGPAGGAAPGARLKTRAGGGAKSHAGAKSHGAKPRGGGPGARSPRANGGTSHGANGVTSHGANGVTSHGANGAKSHGANGVNSHGAHGVKSHGANGAKSHGANGAKSHGAKSQAANGTKSHGASSHGAKAHGAKSRVGGAPAASEIAPSRTGAAHGNGHGAAKPARAPAAPQSPANDAAKPAGGKAERAKPQEEAAAPAALAEPPAALATDGAAAEAESVVEAVTEHGKAH